MDDTTNLTIFGTSLTSVDNVSYQQEQQEREELRLTILALAAEERLENIKRDIKAEMNQSLRVYKLAFQNYYEVFGEMKMLLQAYAIEKRLSKLQEYHTKQRQLIKELNLVNRLDRMIKTLNDLNIVPSNVEIDPEAVQILCPVLVETSTKNISSTKFMKIEEIAKAIEIAENSSESLLKTLDSLKIASDKLSHDVLRVFSKEF